MRSWVFTIACVLSLLSGCGQGDAGEENRCDPDPCVNGDCADEADTYSCTCDPGWEGLDCDVNIDDCASGPCVNGDCTDEVDGYSCTCDPGWEGPDCGVSVCSQVSMDEYEENDTCNQSEELPDAADGASHVTVSDLTLHHTDQTLDTDWYVILATEADRVCTPFSGQCYFVFDIFFAPPDVAAYELYEMCVSAGTCGAEQTCTTAADWNTESGRYELSFAWEGICGLEDDMRHYVRIGRNGGQESCAQYSLEYQMTYTDEVCP